MNTGPFRGRDGDALIIDHLEQMPPGFFVPCFPFLHGDRSDAHNMGEHGLTDPGCAQAEPMGRAMDQIRVTVWCRERQDQG